MIPSRSQTSLSHEFRTTSVTYRSVLIKAQVYHHTSEENLTSVSLVYLLQEHTVMNCCQCETKITHATFITLRLLGLALDQYHSDTLKWTKEGIDRLNNCSCS